jgi:hypothetical protein
MCMQKQAYNFFENSNNTSNNNLKIEILLTIIIIISYTNSIFF